MYVRNLPNIHKYVIDISATKCYIYYKSLSFQKNKCFLLNKYIHSKCNICK